MDFFIESKGETMKQKFQISGTVEVEKDEVLADLREELFDFANKEEGKHYLSELLSKLMFSLVEELKAGTNKGAAYHLLKQVEKGNLSMQDVFYLASMQFVSSSNKVLGHMIP